MTRAWKEFEGQIVDGKFNLRQYLGGSERQAVFLTEQGEQGPQKAAIKLIRPDGGSPDSQLSRWKLTTTLSHPHLIRVFQTGRWQLGSRELLYIVMEYAEENLGQVLPQRWLTPEETRAMLWPTLDALAYLHGKGFVHGHLKPANIMAVGDQLKLSSDGICRMGEPTSSPVKPGVYDPPEIAGRGVSPPGDVWSLGLTLVEALTQRLPTWQGMGRGDPEIPQTMPAPFQDIARHCLFRDPQLRWSVAEIAARVQPAAAAPSAPRVRIAARRRRAPVRSRYLLPAVAAALVVAAILGVPRLLNRGAEPSATEELTQKSSGEKQGPGGVAASSVPLRAEAAAKTAKSSLVPGAVLEQVLPHASQSALDTIHGTVRVSVRVAVDSSGNVADATFDSPGPSRYFARLALASARQWKFRPARADGQNVASAWILRFGFTTTGAKLLAAERAR